MIINSALTGVGACYFALVPTLPSSGDPNKITAGSLYLVADSGTGYASGSPMSVPSSSGVLQNSQCSISVLPASTSTPPGVQGESDWLSVTVQVTFKTAFAGNKIIYAAVQDGSSSGPTSGWQPLGVWAVPTVPSASPSAVSVSR